MQTKPVLSCDQTQHILAAAKAYALQNDWKVSIAITDDGGHLLGMVRLDGAAPMTAGLASAKANMAAIGRKETLIFEEMINQGRTAFLSAPNLGGMLEGGLPILFDGHVIGGIGVSGVKSSDDAKIAQAGLAALTDKA
ncbi:heme-binding protein [Pusillimonas sp. CC-YST705]|uniref:Heme-binding protein n=1 Tax=Mesopusillimonas faecipullorum TaxID=2755040 RepID=A0ABS8CEJ7_9BURK|nr:heme-binding protein [Mesopusillimonas faecipullorum]MCB5364470.1 heme-binding protein [Mesopusillimonas faecipullorum]